RDGLYNYLNAIGLPYKDGIYFSDNINMHYADSKTYQRLKVITTGWKIQNKNLLACGIDVYNEIIGFYSDFLDNKISFDLRPLHLLWEHKKVMLLRMSYMQNVKNIQGLSKILVDYSEIERKSLILRNKLIKYNISNNTDTLVDINKQLTELAEKEKELLYSFYNVILKII
ncbi:MAG: hypothetical protein M1308_10970, partial [Actinobacteria bacterium]|nr:hypothetical protein [Actinomycetota bacterium]